MSEGNAKLPLRWRTAKLSDVCELNPRRSQIARPDNAPTTFLPMPAIGEGGVGIKRVELRPYRELRKGYTSFVEGDVLFAKITPCMQNAKHAIARDLIDGIGFGSTEFHVLRPRDEIISEWIHYFLLQPSLLADATRYFTGAVGQQRVPDDYLSSLAIPLPPLQEQRQITARLREQLSILAEARTALEAQLKAADALPAADLRAVFESEEAQRWPRKYIGDVARVQSGYAFKSEWFTKKGIRLLRNANVAQGRTSWDDTVYLPVDRRKDFADFELNEGDIILSLDRPVVAGGLKLTRLTRKDIPALLLQRVGRFLLKENIDADYLYRMLQADRFIRAITAHDQSLGVPHVSPKQVEAVEILVPPLERQRTLATKLDSQFAEARALRAAIEEKLTQVAKLPAALLRAAFSKSG